MPGNNGLERVVIKLTGNLFDKTLGGSDLKPFIDLFRSIHEDGIQTFIITGGGAVARQYISTARRLGGEEASLDELGIMVSQINAKLLISSLGDVVYPNVPSNLEDVAYAAGMGRIVVCGGLHPGQSTNAVAFLIAEKARAGLVVNASDVDGVYTSDPKTSKKAKRLARATVKQISKMLANKVADAGTYELMDQIALNIIDRSRIPTRIVQCSVDHIRQAVEGRDVGTLVISGN